MTTRIHPSNLRVKDLMTSDVLSVSMNSSMHDAAEAMLQAKESAAVVVDEMGICVGVISSRDFLRYEHDQEEAREQLHGGVQFEVVTDLVEGSHIEDQPFEVVKRHMTPALQTIDANASALVAARYMIDENIHHLFVLDDHSRPVGSLSAMDLIQCFLEHCEMSEGEEH